MVVSNLASVFLFSMPGGSEWIFIVLVVLIFFGGRKIPELMKGIGRGMREFKDAKENVKSEIEEGMNDDIQKSRGRMSPALYFFKRSRSRFTSPGPSPACIHEPACESPSRS